MIEMALRTRTPRVRRIPTSIVTPITWTETNTGYRRNSRVIDVNDS